MVLLGALFCTECTGAAGHYEESAWAFSSFIKGQRTLQRLRAEVVPVLTWGATAWYEKEREVLKHAEGALFRVARICLHVFAPRVLGRLVDPYMADSHGTTRDSLGGPSPRDCCDQCGLLCGRQKLALEVRG